jgi:multidrug efflux pump subunit AcrA (membrane-fusion protein)
LLPNEEVVVSSEVEGPVEKVLVDLGGRVKRGVNKVFVVENGKIRERVIKVGDRFGDDVEVLEGLKGGEVVASSELSRLENDLPVRIK